MVLSDLQTLCSTWLDDTNNGYFTLPILNVYLNNAQREVQKNLLQAGQDWYTKCVQTPIVQYQQDYELPADFLKLHKLECVQSGTSPNEVTNTLGFLTHQESDQIGGGPGLPVAYNLKKTRLQLYPIPDANYPELRLLYSYLVVDMANAGDTPDVPAQYQEYIAVLATVNCFLRDGRDASQFIAMRDRYELMLKQDAQSRKEDESRHVRILNQEGYNNF